MNTSPSPRHRRFQREIENRLQCEVRFDPFARVMYSTDGSNHLIEPIGVAFPRHEEDLFEIVEACVEYGIPLLPRGAGTSLAGQAIGEALILDCARHLDHVLRIDPETRTAEVEPGVVCSALNRAASRHGLMYGPDPASADRATFGGMIGNNATGAHSIRYGMTADNLLALDVVLSDGSGATFASLDERVARHKAQAPTREGRIYGEALRLKEEYAESVRSDWPHTWRRASAYSLNYLTGYSPASPPVWHLEGTSYPPIEGFNLAPLLASSEGTLAVFRKAVVRLVPVPKSTTLVILQFESVADACDATPGLLEYSPEAVELIPRTMLERAASVPAYARRLTFVEGMPEALLVVELAGGSASEVQAKVGDLAKRGRLLDTPEAQDDLWTVRKAGLGLLMGVPGDTKPITFIEDVAVPVDRLGEYVRRVEAILEDCGTRGEWYAHASAGCLHLRPMVNLRTRDGVVQMRRIANAVAEVVVDMRGSFSGEHGDGLSHAEFNERVFGPKLFRAFQELKAAFDPDGLLNPGKVIPPIGEKPPALDQALRFGPDYRAQTLETVFAYRREGDFAHAVEDCSGVGVCRHEDGVMCPSFQATRDEMHLTRGRANALRAAISGILPPESLTSRQMHQVLDLCLECKGCKAECPTGVDMARVKAEFLDMYQAQHGVSLRSRFFGNIRGISSTFRPIAGLVNRMGRFPPSRWLLNLALGLAPQRRLPEFASEYFSDWHGKRDRAASGDEVVLFVDTYTEANYPEVGVAAVRILEALGLQVTILENQACCGRPMISKGLLAQARANAEANLELFSKYAASGIPIVGLEPSCLLTLRDEYLEFFPDDARAVALAQNALLMEEFLTRKGHDGTRLIDELEFNAPSSRWLVHVHCHAKSLLGSNPTLEMLGATGAEVVEIPSGCCGMAGSFGYEREHFDLSMEIGELKLFPAVRASSREGAAILAHGVSCRAQIEDGTGCEAVHPLQAMAQRLKSRSSEANPPA